MKTEGLQAGEDLAARGATAPRVTLNDIKNNVGAVFFTTAFDAIAEQPADANDDQYLAPLKILTICFVVLKNGFVLLGKSAPADAANFDAEKGREFAYEDALRQCWPLMGYALRERLHNASASGLDAVEVQAIPDDAELDAMDADALVSLAIRHGYPEAGHGRDDAQIFLRVKRDGGTYTQPGNADLAGEVVDALPAIPSNEELGTMDDNEIYDLARAHDLPAGDDPSREHDIASLITKRDSAKAEVVKADGPLPIEGDEELEGANDGYIKELAVAHGLEYVDRADAIAKLKVRRDSVLTNHNAANGGQPNPV